MTGEFGRHAGYILASYAVTFVILGGLILQTVLRYRAAKARLGPSGDDRG
jgi:heme exporter protein CcmD